MEKGEARLVSLACSNAPEGYGRWTLHLLADRLVELNIVDPISHECGCQVMNTPPAKAGGFGLRLKAGLVGHSAD